jgi:hypothetical protein
LRKLLDYDLDVLQRGNAAHRLKPKHMDALIDPIDSTPLPTPEEQQDNKPAKAVKVFSYACKIAYPEEAAHVEHQLTLTHRHRNLLTETLLKGREKYREIIKEHLGLDIKALEEQAEEITTEIKAVQQEISDWKRQNRTPLIASCPKNAVSGCSVSGVRFFHNAPRRPSQAGVNPTS